MLRIGPHVSISGGVEKSISRAVDLGGNTGQIFVGSPQGWAVNEFDESDAEAFKDEIEAADVDSWLVHGTYLINFATPKDDLGERSVETLQAELDACGTLGIPYYVFHPGSHTGAGVEPGLENIGRRLSQLDIPEETTLLLENTAGKGTSLGKTFAELDRMVATSDYDYDDIGICLDSCHLYAAGYDFTTESGFGEMLEEFDDAIGLENLEYLHLNDSKHPLGSQKDEHEHIGDGEIGEEGFDLLVNHEQTRDLPMVLETPTNGIGYAENIDRVRHLYE